jgi:hypothetical protein
VCALLEHYAKPAQTPAVSSALPLTLFRLPTPSLASASQGLIVPLATTLAAQHVLVLFGRLSVANSIVHANLVINAYIVTVLPVTLASIRIGSHLPISTVHVNQETNVRLVVIMDVYNVSMSILQ